MRKAGCVIKREALTEETSNLCHLECLTRGSWLIFHWVFGVIYVMFM